MVKIKELKNTLPNGFEELEAAAKSEGFKFVTKLRINWVSGENKFDKPGEILLGAFLGTSLIGVCGRNIDPYTADPKVGRIRHLYVLPEFRKLGTGKELVKQVINGADRTFFRLRLRTDNLGASKFYEKVGFQLSNEEFETHTLSLL